MPATTKQKNSSSRTRSGAYRRKNRKEHRREGIERTKQKGPRIIANSFFALTLKEKPGLEVFDKIEIRSDYNEADDYYAMYHDLLAAYQNGMRLIGKETKVDPLKEGLNIGTSLSFVINGFKNNLLIGGYDVRIDRDGDHYYFTMYIACDIPEYWHAFELMPVVEYLKTKSLQLHDVFLKFIAYMKSRLNILTWYNGGCGFAEYQMEEKVDLDMWEEWDMPMTTDPKATKAEKKQAQESKERYDLTLNTFNNYKAGVIRVYEQYLTDHISNKEEIKNRLSRFDKKIPIVRWMKQAMEFMEQPGCISDYVYQELIQGEEYEGLTFDRQVTIIWDWNDEYTRLEMEAIDDEASNVGTVPPIFHYHISKHTKELNLDKYLEWQSWPMRFSKLWEKYRDIANDCRSNLKPQNKK
jgi:hypothetical protein